MSPIRKLSKLHLHVPANYEFPLRKRNSFELFIDGENFFPAILNDINQATEFIYIEMYLVTSGNITNQFIEALINAAARGVKVYTLFDHYGSKDFKQRDVDLLEKAAVNFAWFNPVKLFQLRSSLHRTHRKIFVIDHAIAWTGGSGITDEFDYNENPKLYWHDSMIRIQGKCVRDWKNLFEQEWRHWSGSLLPKSTGTEDSELMEASTENYCQQGRVVSSRSIYHSEVRRSLIASINRSSKRVWLTTAYFVPSRKLRRKLIKASIRGIDVRIMLPGPMTVNPGVRYMARRYYARLLRHGVRIYEYQQRFLHSKYTIVDHWVSNGSSNLDLWNLTWNLDANQEMFDTNIAAMHEKMFLQDMELCQCFTYAEWVKRPLWARLGEGFWGRVRAFLAWISRRETMRQRH